MTICTEPMVPIRLTAVKETTGYTVVTVTICSMAMRVMTGYMAIMAMISLMAERVMTFYPEKTATTL